MYPSHPSCSPKKKLALYLVLLLDKWLLLLLFCVVYVPQLFELFHFLMWFYFLALSCIAAIFQNLSPLYNIRLASSILILISLETNVEHRLIKMFFVMNSSEL
jgi:hypothetical protein